TSFFSRLRGCAFLHVKAEKRNKLKEWHDLWFDEYKRAGYVAVTDFKKQYFYGSNDIERLINATIGKKKQFISINAFDIDWENKVFSRETARLKQIRNIDRKSTRLNSSHVSISYAVFCLKKKRERIPRYTL